MVERNDVQLQIQLDDDVAQGIYTNMAMVNNNETEFTLDFMFIQPQTPKGQGPCPESSTSPKQCQAIHDGAAGGLSPT